MDITRVRNAVALVAALTLGAVAFSGCGGSGVAAETSAAAPRVAPSTSAPADAATAPAEVARLRGATEVFASPGGALERSLEAVTGFGSPTVLLITEIGRGDAAGWLRVMLPGRPNGALGWIRSDAAEVREVALALHVDLTARELVLRDGDDVVWRTATAVGDIDHPTPTGLFYVTDKLDTGDPDGAYGPFAIGLSARSEVLTEFAGGDGQIGIHGTNVPSSIGQAASHGCLRISNTLVAELAALLPLGTPVTIS